MTNKKNISLDIEKMNALEIRSFTNTIIELSNEINDTRVKSFVQVLRLFSENLNGNISLEFDQGKFLGDKLKEIFGNLENDSKFKAGLLQSIKHIPICDEAKKSMNEYYGEQS